MVVFYEQPVAPYRLLHFAPVWFSENFSGWAGASCQICRNNFGEHFILLALQPVESEMTVLTTQSLLHSLA